MHTLLSLGEMRLCLREEAKDLGGGRKAGESSYF